MHPLPVGHFGKQQQDFEIIFMKTKQKQ